MRLHVALAYFAIMIFALQQGNCPPQTQPGQPGGGCTPGPNPCPPSELRVISAVNNEVVFAWRENGYVDGHVYLRCVGDCRGEGNFEQFYRDNVGNNSLRDNGVSPGSTYTYYVCTRYNNRLACTHERLVVTTTSNQPETPTAQSAYHSSLLGRRCIRFQWTQPCFRSPCIKPDGWRIERYSSLAGGMDKNFNHNQTSYTDCDVAPGVDYVYRVCAYNKFGMSCPKEGTSAPRL